MGQALYRKYRSKSLNELVGQEHITQTLAEAIKTGKIAHAYLFTGPRGVGKTSTARILAHAINNLPYEDGQTHLDIIEIDAASNNSVEDIRDLREKVYVAPTSSKYKVYIIDEVHMLSKAAFNAILKTLEEPPAHAVFILATTESHKLPDTIISRTQRFIFRPVSTPVAANHLRTIADAEKITITDAALELLAQHGDGSFRDSISLLDQASSLGRTIEITDVQRLLGIPDGTAIRELTDAVSSIPFALAPAMQNIYSLYAQGFQATAIAHELSVSIRAMITDGKLQPHHHIVTLLERLLDVPTKRDPERFLEVVMLSLASVAAPIQQTATPAPAPIPQPLTSSAHATPQPAIAARPKASAKTVAATDGRRTEASETTNESPSKLRPAEALVELDPTIWPQVLDALKKQYNTLYGIIRMATVSLNTHGEIQLGFAFAFHQKRVNEAKNREIIADILQTITGKSIVVVCIHNPDLKSAKPGVVASAPPALTTAPAAPAPLASDSPLVPANADASLSAISNIFGGGELLQS